MDIRHAINLFVPLLLLLVLFALAARLARRRKGTPKSAPRTDPIARIAETLILLSASLTAFGFIGFFNDGLLLQLDKLRPEFAMTHVIVAAVVAALLILGVLLAWLGRTSLAVLLTTIVLFCYGTIVTRSPFDGPGYLMTLIAPKDSYEPQVNYTFRVNGGIEGADVWINGVLLGKTPLKMTGRQFHEKVPFLTEPPEGFSEQSRLRPKGGWFKINVVVLNKQRDRPSGGIHYHDTFEKYWAKIRLAGEWGEDGVGGCGGGGNQYQREYEVGLRASFPGVISHADERKRRLETLVQKVRLADYQTEPKWFEAMATYGEDGWMEIRKLALTEKGFAEVVDNWVEWKYGVRAETTTDQAREIFGQICHQADADREYNSASPAGRAVELIFENLDVDKLVRMYEDAIKSGRPMYSSRASKDISESLGGSYFKTRHEPDKDDRKKVLPASVSVIGHAVRLWDGKLDAEDDDKDNIVERRISPAFLARQDVENAAAFGGQDIEIYLLRHYQWESRVSGIGLKSRDREWMLGLHLNKWLYRLAHLDDPAGRRFRIKHDRDVTELADLIVGSPHNNSRTPPDFLFFDLDRGKASLGYEYWPAYFTHVESSFPGWQQDKLKKRWTYLVRLGSLATVEMYMQCWSQMSDEDSLDNSWRILRELKDLPREIRIPVAKAIIEKGQGQLAGKEESDTWREKEDMRQKRGHIETIRIHLACLDDAESIDWLMSHAGSAATAGEIASILWAFQSEDMLGHRLMEALVRHEISDLRKLPLETIRKQPTAQNRTILKTLLADAGEEVRSAAQIVAEELEEVMKMPVHELAADRKGIEP